MDSKEKNEWLVPKRQAVVFANKKEELKRLKEELEHCAKEIYREARGIVRHRNEKAPLPGPQRPEQPKSPIAVVDFEADQSQRFKLKENRN